MLSVIRRPGGGFFFVLLLQFRPTFLPHPREQRIFHGGLLLFEQRNPCLHAVQSEFPQIRRLWRSAFPGPVGGQQIAGNQARLRHPELCQFFPNLRFQLPQTVLRPIRRMGQPGIPHHHAGTGERAVKAVIIAGRNRVELVIVAARTGDGEPLKCLAQGVDLVIDHVCANLPEPDAVVMPQFAHPQKRRPQDRFVDRILRIHARLIQKVSGQMFANQLVIRNVLIERADEVVAIEPGALDLVIPVVAECFGKTHHVHPVARPVFAEMR